MKIIILTGLLINSVFLWAETEETKIVVGTQEQLQIQEREIYKGAKKSLIPWKELDHKDWFSINEWKRVLKVKESVPSWRANIVEANLHERMARVLECEGECRIYRGEGHSKAQYRSELKEGDELHTLKDSYVWVFFLDGTLARLSPQSSISFKEINLGKKENFLHVRLNAGNILWLNRSKNTYQLQETKETDVTFYPLKMYEANPVIRALDWDEKDPFSYLKDEKIIQGQYKRLNEMIEENNEVVRKKTHSFIVFPNGTILGEGLSMEFIILNGGKTYLKKRTSDQLKLKGSTSNIPTWFYFRGYENTEEFKIPTGRWMEVDPKGRVISLTEGKRFSIGEFITSNIPSILMARELMLKKYSSFAHEELSKKELAIEYGYRLWGSIENEGEDLYRRLQFLRDYTRRHETTQIITATQFYKKLERLGEKRKNAEYTRAFFSKAMQDYYIYKDSLKLLSRESEIPSSVKRPLWQRMNGIR
jgi:hypothetical protein